MQELRFQVAGSASEPYLVRFLFDAGRVTASCTCNAGAMKQICKHRRAIAEGEIADVVDADLSAVSTAKLWIEQSEFGAALQLLRDAELHAEEAKGAVAVAKKAVNAHMVIPLPD